MESNQNAATDSRERSRSNPRTSVGRNHRGYPSLLSIASKLPPWANRIHVWAKSEEDPRELRIAYKQLGDLQTLLKVEIENREAAETVAKGKGKGKA